MAKQVTNMCLRNLRDVDVAQRKHLYNVFETFDVPPNNRDGCFSGVQHQGFDFTIFRGCG